MTEDTAESAFWPALVAALPPDAALGVTPGECVRTLREADAATLRLGLPVRAVPLVPRGGFAAQCASHQADAELAFLRARSQSVDGAVWMQAEQHGDRYWAVCSQADGAWCVRHWIGVASLRGHAAVPVCFIAPQRPPSHGEIEVDLARVLNMLAPPAVQVIAQVVCQADSAVLDFAWADVEGESHLARLEAALATHIAACLQFLQPEAGHVIAVFGVDQVRAMPGVLEVGIVAKVDDAIRHVTSVAARDAVGWVLCAGATPEDAQARAEHAAAGIEIETTAFLQG